TVFSSSTNRPKLVTELIIPVNSSSILSSINSAFFKSSTSLSASTAARSISEVCFVISGNASFHFFIILLDIFPFNKYVRIKRRSEEHTSELQSRFDLVCRLLLEKKNY